MNRIILITALFSFCCNSSKQEPKAETIYVSDASVVDTFSLKFDSAMNIFDSINIAGGQLETKIKQLEKERDEYRDKEAELITTQTDTSAMVDLRKKLMTANAEIAKLKEEKTQLEKTKPKIVKDTVVVSNKVALPDDEAVIVYASGQSKHENVNAKDLLIYLIPFKSETKKYAQYEAGCSAALNVYNRASYSNGLYYFNSVEPGKYIIKICTYYGDYKIIKKKSGKHLVQMQVSPPVQ